MTSLPVLVNCVYRKGKETGKDGFERRLRCVVARASLWARAADTVMVDMTGTTASLQLFDQ